MPVREMKEEDLPEVLEIQKALAFQDWNERQFCAEIAADYALCVVYEDGAQFNTGNDAQFNTCESKTHILGYAVFHLMGPDSELLSIASRKDSQCKGIGTKLLQAGLAHLDFEKGDKMFLEVREGNSNARHFYEKHGFAAFANRKNYYADGENAILYQKVSRSDA